MFFHFFLFLMLWLRWFSCFVIFDSALLQISSSFFELSANQNHLTLKAFGQIIELLLGNYISHLLI